MGLALIPAGGILSRDANIVKAVSMKIPYLSRGETEQATIVGTRLGASSAAVWPLLECLGREGYREMVKRCIKLTRKLAEGISQINEVSLVTQPIMNIIGVKSDIIDTRLIAQRLREKG